MAWEEFSNLLSGLGPETALGRIITIRTEDQADTLKYFSAGQHEIRDEWRRKEQNRKDKYDKINRKKPVDPYAALTTMFSGLLGAG